MGCSFDRMTPKLIKRYNNKGIFTIKQLSYLFKPRKRGKRSPKKWNEFARNIKYKNKNRPAFQQEFSKIISGWRDL